MTDYTIQPGTMNAVIEALAAQPRPERDFFPCAFCGERYDTRAERASHEGACGRADDSPKVKYPKFTRFNIRTRQLPNGQWEATEEYSFDSEPGSRWNIRGQGDTAIESAMWLLEYLRPEIERKS